MTEREKLQLKEIRKNLFYVRRQIELKTEVLADSRIYAAYTKLQECVANTNILADFYANCNLTDEEKLKLIQEINDNLFYIYDEYRFNSKYFSYPEVEKIKNTKKLVNSLLKDYLSNDKFCFQITVSEDTVIKNEETIEIDTNMSGLPFDEENMEIMFNGCIPSDGYLALYYVNSDEGLQFFIKNCVPKEVAEENKGGYCCDPTTTRYYWSGSYFIEEGTVIGIGFRKKEKALKKTIEEA